MPAFFEVEISVPGHLMVEDLNEFVEFSDVKDLSSHKTGGTAHVVMGKLRNSKDVHKHGFFDVAVKFFHSNAENHKSFYANFRYEVSLMSALPDSPYLAKLIGYTENPMVIIMKRYLSSLAECLEQPGFFKDYETRRFKASIEIALGMEVIHSKNIVHFDLKPGNLMSLLVSSSDVFYLGNVLVDIRSFSDYNFLICDFGFADYAPEAGRQVVAGMKRPSNTGITPRYAAPEVSKSMCEKD